MIYLFDQQTLNKRPMISEKCNGIFKRSIEDYHVHDEVNTPVQNPFPAESLEHLFYLKNWIDTVQWHLEDIIRDPNIDPVEALRIKRLVKPRYSKEARKCMA